MTTTDIEQVPKPFTTAIERFLRIQEGRNRSPQTLRAYRSDLTQLAIWLHEDNSYLTDPPDVTGDDLNEYLASLAHRGVSGVSRARKLAAIREFYRSLKNSGLIEHSPVDGVDTPKRERRARTYLTPEEYNRLLAPLAPILAIFASSRYSSRPAFGLANFVNSAWMISILPPGYSRCASARGCRRVRSNSRRKAFARQRPG